VDGTSPEPTTATADIMTPATAEAAADSSVADLLAEDYNAAYPDYYYGGEGTYPPEYYDELGGGTTFAPEDEQRDELRDELAPLAEEIVPEPHNSLQPGGSLPLKEQYNKKTLALIYSSIPPSLLSFLTDMSFRFLAFFVCVPCFLS
jgi:hypothetical protein